MMPWPVTFRRKMRSRCFTRCLSPRTTATSASTSLVTAGFWVWPLHWAPTVLDWAGLSAGFQLWRRSYSMVAVAWKVFGINGNCSTGMTGPLESTSQWPKTHMHWWQKVGFSMCENGQKMLGKFPAECHGHPIICIRNAQKLELGVVKWQFLSSFSSGVLPRFPSTMTLTPGVKKAQQFPTASSGAFSGIRCFPKWAATMRSWPFLSNKVTNSPRFPPSFCCRYAGGEAFARCTSCGRFRVFKVMATVPKVSEVFGSQLPTVLKPNIQYKQSKEVHNKL